MIIRALLFLALCGLGWAHHENCENFDNIYDKDDCEANEKCEKPKQITLFTDKSNNKHNTMECPKGDAPSHVWKLEVKLASGARHTDAAHVECGNDGVRRDPDRRNAEVAWMRCVRRVTQQEQFELWKWGEGYCPKHHKCDKPTFDAGYNAVCPAGTTLEKNIYVESSYTGEWMEIASLKALEAIMKYAVKSAPSAEKENDNGVRFRCRTKKECKLDEYFNSLDCATGQTCTKPLDTYDCPVNTVLQMKTFNDGPWRNIDSLKCVGKRFVIVLGGQDSDLVPVHFRCLQESTCATQYAFETADCDSSKEKCEKPALDSDGKFKCGADPLTSLQVKVDKLWSPATSITCTANKMSAILADQKTIADFPHPIRCVKLRCTECTEPCSPAGCAVVTAPTKFGDCKTFKCPTATPLITVGSKFWLKELKCVVPLPQDRNQWTSDGKEIVETNLDAICKAEVKCSATVQIDSKCTGAAHLCEKAIIDDHTPATCADGGRIVHVKKEKTDEEEIESAKCDLISGEWKVAKRNKKNNELVEEVFQSGDNIFCRFDDCKIESVFAGRRVCPPGEKGGCKAEDMRQSYTNECPSRERCIEPEKAPADTYACPAGYDLRYLGVDDQRIVKSDAKFTCLRGKIRLNGEECTARTSTRSSPGARAGRSAIPSRT